MNKLTGVMSVVGFVLMSTAAAADENTILVNPTDVPVVAEVTSGTTVPTDKPAVRPMKIKCPIRPNTENNTLDHDGELCIPFYRNLMDTVQSSQTTSPFVEVGRPNYR